MEDWNTINLIQNWRKTKINKINKSSIGKFWIETQTGNTKLQWLVDTGSPRRLHHKQQRINSPENWEKAYRREQPKLANSDVSTTTK